MCSDVQVIRSKVNLVPNDDYELSPKGKNDLSPGMVYSWLWLCREGEEARWQTTDV